MEQLEQADIHNLVQSVKWVSVGIKAILENLALTNSLEQLFLAYE